MNQPLFRAYIGNEPYIFISYANKDKEIILQEIAKLQSQGYRVWYDEGIHPTYDWRDELITAINGCSLFLVYLTAAAVIPTCYVLKETFWAIQKKKRILCILWENVHMPDQLKFEIQSIQYLTRFNLSTTLFGQKLFETLPLETQINSGIPRSKDKVQEIKSDGSIINAEQDILKEWEPSTGSIPIVPDLHLKDFTIGAVIFNHHVVKLGLINRNLMSIPNNIGYLSMLKDLHLGRNRLSTLPESISELAVLKTLTLNHNHLNEIPFCIWMLHSLCHLDIGSNKIEILSEDICNLKSLTLLALYENLLSELPRGLVKLKELQYLYLQSNQIHNLPLNFDQLSSLIELNLNHNRFTAVPESIWNLKGLRILQLGSNEIKTLSDSIENLFFLENLNIQYNNLSTLPGRIIFLPNLQSLDLSFNLFSTVPEELLQLSSLRELFLTGNPICTSPKRIYPCIKELEKKGCQVIGFPPDS